MNAGRLLATFALVATMTVTASAHAARTWLPPERLSLPSAVESDGADVGMDAAGNAVAIWMRVDGTATCCSILQTSTRPVGGAWSAPRDLSPAGRDARKAQIKMNLRGDALVVWVEQGPSGYTVRYRSRPAGGDFGASQPLSEPDPDGEAIEPSVAMNGSGAAVVSWTQGQVPLVVTRDGVAEQFGLPQPLTDVETSARVAIDDAGNAIAAWFNGLPERRFATSIRPAGTAWQAPVVIPGSDGAYSYRPQVAMHPSGRALVVWLHPSPGDSVITYAIRERIDKPWTQFGNIGQLFFPRGIVADIDRDGTPITAFGGGPIGATFTLYGSDIPIGPSGRIKMSGFYFNDETPWGVTPAPGGGTLVHWSGENGFEARWRPPGGAFGAFEDIPGSKWVAGESGVGLDDEANGVAVWQEWDATNTLTSVWTARLDAAPPAVHEVAVPETVTAGTAATLRVAASDRLSAVNVFWRYSDGATAEGFETTRAFATPGTVDALITIRDAVGNERQISRTISVVAPPEVVRDPDGDGDGVRASLDCDDANAAIFPGARERLGNAIDENCDGRRDPYPTVTATALLTSQFRSDRSTRLLSLTVSDLMAGDTVRLSCRGKGCRKAMKRTVRVSRTQRTLRLNRQVAGARLRPGAVLEVAISHPERIARVFSFTMRSRASASGPRKVRRCLAPGQTRAIPC